MLQQAETVARVYAAEIAKAPPPARTPLMEKALETASVWFTIDLKEVATDCHASVWATLTDEWLIDALRGMGVEGLRLIGLKQGGGQRTGLSIDPRWGSEAQWDQLSSLLQKKGMALIGDTVGESTGTAEDFHLAVKNYEDYPSLYHLVEIPRADWKLLPLVPKGDLTANIPWLAIPELRKRGYISEQYSPFTKESAWNATERVSGVDGKTRRWIYLKENKGDPILDWLDPSFAAMRLAAGDTLDSYYRLGQKVFHLGADLDPYAQENLPLWIRKMGAFTVQESQRGHRPV